eukprot:3183689-Alexandrium_andersonii.AAC.1
MNLLPVCIKAQEPRPRPQPQTIRGNSSGLEVAGAKVRPNSPRQRLAAQRAHVTAGSARK